MAIIENLEVNIPPTKHVYEFKVTLSSIDVEKLKKHTLFGGLISINKSKFEFTCDLVNLLAKEITIQFEQLDRLNLDTPQQTE